MVLKDIVSEYKVIYDLLQNCDEYFTAAEELIKKYYASTSSAVTNYFSSSQNDSAKSSLATALHKASENTYNAVTVLITKTFDFYGAMVKLKEMSFTIPELNNLINDFIENSNASIAATNNIITAQLANTKSRGLLIDLIIPLQKTVSNYYALSHLYSQIISIENILLEPLPQHIKDTSIYTNLTIQSFSSSHTLDQVTESLSELTQVFSLLDRLHNPSSEKNYYIRKIETGSLLTDLYALTSLAILFVKSIDYCYLKYMNWKQLHYSDKEAQLKLAKEEIATMKEYLEISPDCPGADELIETASTRLFKYFDYNPEFKVNDKEYRRNSEIKLIEKSKD